MVFNSTDPHIAIHIAYFDRGYCRFGGNQSPNSSERKSQEDSTCYISLNALRIVGKLIIGTVPVKR